MSLSSSQITKYESKVIEVFDLKTPYKFCAHVKVFYIFISFFRYKYSLSKIQPILDGCTFTATYFNVNLFSVTTLGGSYSEGHD